MLLRILFFCLIPLSLKAQIWVGNGGEGIRDGEELYVRDLYEKGLHLSPYFGKFVSDEIRRQADLPDMNLELTERQQELLLRKLTDIDERYPCLGTMLLRAISLYNWWLVDEPLELLLDKNPTKYIGRRVQIATRLFRSVYMYRSPWDKLTDEHRVAMIVHEVVYAMINPEQVPGKPDHYQQSVDKTRDITAGFFVDSPTLDIEYRQLIDHSFGLPEKALRCDSRLEKFQLSFWGADGVLKLQSALDLQNLQSLRSQIANVCQKLDPQTPLRYKVQVSYNLQDSFQFIDYFSMRFDHIRTRSSHLRVNSSSEKDDMPCVLDPGEQSLPAGQCGTELLASVERLFSLDRLDSQAFRLCSKRRRLPLPVSRF